MANSFGSVMRYNVTSILLAMGILLCALMSCRQETSFSSDIEILELEEYETLVAVNDTALAVPSIIRYDGDAGLFVYDGGRDHVLELDGSGTPAGTYGRPGRGPGEFQRVNNLFLTEEHLYVVDHAQYVIHRYERDGNLNSSMDYGQVMGLGNPAAPPPPGPGSVIEPRNINNQPFVTLQGDVLLSSVQFNENIQTIYELRDWEGERISDMGAVPEGSAFVLDFDDYNAAVDNREVPDYYKSNAFPVTDYANRNEVYMIYSAFPKIEKYNRSGEKLWEREVLQTAELDSLGTHFFDVSEQMGSRERIALKKYVAGTSGNNGCLYLALGKYSDFSNALWIHEFNREGELVQRYKLVSEDVDLVPIFDVDSGSRRFFVATEEGEIRAYGFR